MKTTPEHNERIAKMTFASVYPHYITKVESKGRTKDELHQVIEWLTSFDNKKIQELIDEKATFETFFKKAKLNPNAHLITGVICGYRRVARFRRATNGRKKFPRRSWTPSRISVRYGRKN